MSKARMVFYGAMGSLVSVLIWSFIGGCHTSSGPDPSPERLQPSAREEAAPAPAISEETLIEEGIIVREETPVLAGPVEEETDISPAAEAAPSRIHIVEQGDTLWGISRLYGVTVTAIEEVNQLEDPGRLAVGQRLVIP